MRSGSPSSQAGRAGSSETQPPARIIRVGRNAWREAVADDCGILIDAADYYRALYWSARRARRSILMSGWQFDSGVELLRGAEVPPDAEVRLLKFLDRLCEQNPELRIHLLAWDFHLVLAGEREWMQRIYFHWMTNPRFQFLFDECPVPQASHHQKFAIIDGTVAFIGGMDVCEARWDDRRHCGENPLRTSRGRPSKPYHDVQAYLAGRDAAGVLEELFWERWTRAGGERPSPARGEEPSPVRPAGLLPIGAGRVAFSRTDPCVEPAETVREVESLLVDAILAASRLIYVETQYFSSRRLCQALEARMSRGTGSRLEIIVVVNERAEALKEEVAVGLRQAENLQRLREAARRTGQAFGLYYSVCQGITEDFRATYIHSKVMVIDDRFLTVGSANFTNRSMGLDSEVHVSWEADPTSDERLCRAIRKVRVSLLAEHAGLSGVAAIGRLARTDGIVARLDEIASRPGARLQRHGPPSPAQVAALQVVDPKELPFDPETAPVPGDRDYEEPADERTWSSSSALATAAGALRRMIGR